MRLTFIGSGNVATHMAAAFKNAGHRIVQVYSPNLHNASLLAYHVGADATNNIADIIADTDLFIISVKDDAIEQIAQTLASHQKLMVHTSGATSLDVLLKYTGKAGVLYPLQTFSKTREVDFLNVPLCIEAANDIIYADLQQFAATVSNRVYSINSAGRKILHLAAVFACNFPNYLYGVAQQLLTHHQLDFNLLRPLILETAEKVQEQPPASVQTGPAVRNDQSTMAAHLQLLHNEPQMQAIYTLLSQAIIKNNIDGRGDK